jgi:hypothetical protein
MNLKHCVSIYMVCVRLIGEGGKDVQAKRLFIGHRGCLDGFEESHGCGTARMEDTQTK